MLDDHLQHKIDNENNYNTILVPSQILTKISINVQSCESSLAVAFCCFFLAWTFLYVLNFAWARIDFVGSYSEHANFSFPNIFILGVRISKRLFLVDVVSVYPLVDAWPCLASFTKLWQQSV